MCGITGIIDLIDRREISRALLTQMNDRQVHRGPDEHGIHLEAGVGLGHRRLSIIDLSSGQQPLYNEDRSVVVVYNGEIYNFHSLATELKALGHRFATHCDTEVIVHAWEQWGEDCLHRLRGMFAFAIWDRNTETIFLARDRLGIKPLYYAHLPDGRLLFASELKALRLHPDTPRDLDPYAIEDYFSYGYIPEPRTIIKGINKLEPGHFIKARRSEAFPTPVKYWDVAFGTHLNITEHDASDELIERIREATKIRMIADVPLGAFLSGGVDSSAVVALMSQLSHEPVKTCSISFDDPQFNEAAYAQLVADRYATSHRVEQIDPNDFDLVDRLAAIYDEPYADSSAMPTFRVCELARKSVTVALSGDGGDENLAGYRRYRWHTYEERLRSMLPLGLRRSVFGPLGSAYPKLDWAPKVLRAKTTFESLARSSVEAYFHSVSILPDEMRKRLFSASLLSELQGYNGAHVLQTQAAQAPSDHPLSLVQYLDMKTYLVGDILTKVDRASMANSLEVRVPLLDHELVDWISCLPPGLKLRGREGKYILKKGLEPLLPESILYRPKMGFAVPLANWFRGVLSQRVRDALLGPTLNDTGLFDRSYLETIVTQHQSGRRDFSAPIWTMLMFDAYLRLEQPR